MISACNIYVCVCEWVSEGDIQTEDEQRVLCVAEVGNNTQEGE